MMRLSRLSLALSLLGLCILSSRHGEKANAQPAAPDPLLALNKAFRKAYADTRKELLARSDPLILSEGDELVLLHHGKRQAVRVVPEKYHTLKAISHVPLAIYVLLLPVREGALSESLLENIVAYRKQLGDVESGLDGRGFSAETLTRLRQMLADSRKLLDGVLAARRLQPGELTAFARRQGPPLLEIIAEAARAELDALHRQVSAWKATLAPEEWKRLRVVILGSQMPRTGNLTVQYFARLLREPGEGPRIIYAEGLGDEGRALQLLGTHLLDTEIAGDFFLDRRRMHRDLLADAAAAYLAELNFDPASGGR